MINEGDCQVVQVCDRPLTFFFFLLWLAASAALWQIFSSFEDELFEIYSHDSSHVEDIFFFFETEIIHLLRLLSLI